MFEYCTCGHVEEVHAMDAPKGENLCGGLSRSTPTCSFMCNRS